MVLGDGAVVEHKETTRLNSRTQDKRDVKLKNWERVPSYIFSLAPVGEVVVGFEGLVGMCCAVA